MMTTARRKWAAAALLVAAGLVLTWWLSALRVRDQTVLDLSQDISIHGLKPGLPRSAVQATLARTKKSEFPWWSGPDAVTFTEANSVLESITGYCVQQGEHTLPWGVGRADILTRLGRPNWITTYRGEEIWVYDSPGGYLEVYWDYYLVSMEPRVAMYYSLTSNSVHAARNFDSDRR